MKRILLAALAAFFVTSARADQPPTAPTVNGSVVITVGNTFQTVLASVTLNNRRSLTIQNNNATDSCWSVFGGVLGNATKGTAMLLLSGGSYTRYYPYIPSDAIHATCASNADTLYV